jgi:hypothetical protein
MLPKTYNVANHLKKNLIIETENNEVVLADT